jgi:hypothetical protein
MGQLLCQNPECQKTYNSEDKDSDMDYCSFHCWEKINCQEPQKIIFEDIPIIE